MNYAVVVEQLVKYYGSLQALRGISFRVPMRGITVILGPNGAGKTTTLRAISGALKISGGRVEVLGHDVARDPVRVKSLIGVVPELPYLFPGLSVEDNLRLAGRLHGLRGEELHERIMEIAEELGLRSMLGRKYRGLSKGFKRRVDIAAALIHKPRLLILDEPTGGLDLLAAVRLREIVRRLASQDTAIILSTHNVSEAASLADYVIVLVDGRIGFTGSPDRLKDMLGGEAELVIMVDGEASKLAAGIKQGGIRVEGSILRVRARNKLEALKDVIRASEQLGIPIQGISMHEPSWEEIFLRLFKEGVASSRQYKGEEGCICEGA